MHIHEIWIRFYKSFNFDYELKAKPGAKVRAWQETPEGWMPHVRIPVEPDITAVVGANESGKSHLLDAIKIVLTGEDHLQRDFCRSLALFSVEHGSRLYPEVGATFRIDDADRALLQEHEIPLSSGGNLLMLRPRPEAVEVVDASDQRVELETEQIEALTSLLPYPYDLQTEIALPDSVSIAALSGDTTILAPRKSRGRLWTLFGMLKTEDDYKNEATNVLSLLTGDEPAKGP